MDSLTLKVVSRAKLISITSACCWASITARSLCTVYLCVPRTHTHTHSPTHKPGSGGNELLTLFWVIVHDSRANCWDLEDKPPPLRPTPITHFTTSVSHFILPGLIPYCTRDRLATFAQFVLNEAKYPSPAGLAMWWASWRRKRTKERWCFKEVTLKTHWGPAGLWCHCG